MEAVDIQVAMVEAKRFSNALIAAFIADDKRLRGELADEIGNWIFEGIEPDELAVERQSMMLYCLANSAHWAVRLGAARAGLSNGELLGFV